MWIEVFKAGEHTDSSGKSHTFDNAALERIVEKYNEQIRKHPAIIAPIVKGHPLNDSPAYGWVERLARRGNKLLAKIKEIEQNFHNELKNGRYKKVSIALYPDFSLKHIGFLGAAQPAVKGLTIAKFDHYSDYSQFENAFEVNAKSELDNEIATIKTETSELEEKVHYYKSKLEFLEKENRLKEYRNYISNLMTGKKFTPAQVADAVDLLELCYRIDEEAKQSGTFSESNAFENKLKRMINFILNNDITQELEITNNLKAEKKFDFDRKYINSTRYGIHNRAEVIMTENPGISYEEAVISAFKEKY